MLSEALADASTVQIDITDETKSVKYDIFIYKPYTNKPQPILPRQQLEYIDFEQYVKENLKNKIQILNRKSFHLIKRPIVLAFHHFREKCAYHTKWLDRIYTLALKYGKHIEFIVADIFDLDIIYPGRNPINLFSRLVKSEDVTVSVYAINEKKHIHQHFDAYNSVETLMELYENLLSGKLYPSLPLPKHNQCNIIKTCVHDNFEELVLKSHKNIFLIINVENYQFYQYEPNYHNVAKALKHYNIDIVYMEAERNYIPFEYHVSYYPSLIYIPHNDKDFVCYDEPREEKTIIAYLKNIMENPEFLKVQQQNLKSQILRKTVQVPKDFQIEFKDLTQFLENNFNNNLKTLNRNVLENTKDSIIIVFMDFQQGKCLRHHVQWLNKIYQVAENASTFQYFIADFKDIDVINTRWQSKDLIEKSQGIPKIYAMDHLKHTYELESFDSIAKLFYFTESVQSGDLYYMQSETTNNLQQMVKELTADYLKIFLKNTKKNIFIAFYSSDDEKSKSLTDLLELLAYDVKDMNVDVVKFDVKWNYVDLEYAQPNYPALYCIPRSSKRHSRLFKDNYLNRVKILEFIKNTIE